MTKRSLAPPPKHAAEKDSVLPTLASVTGEFLFVPAKSWWQYTRDESPAAGAAGKKCRRQFFSSAPSAENMQKCFGKQVCVRNTHTHTLARKTPRSRLLFSPPCPPLSHLIILRLYLLTSSASHRIFSFALRLPARDGRKNCKKYYIWPRMLHSWCVPDPKDTGSAGVMLMIFK